MSYINLRNFQTILNRKDFNYISDYKKIKDIEEIILYRISNPDGRESIYIKLLKEFLENLTSFYDSISGRNIPDIKKGYLLVIEELQKCIKLFTEPEFKRKSISRGYCKKFNKILLYGLNLIYTGLDESFKVDGGVNLSTTYFVNYLIDSNIGLGSKYIFNQKVIKDIKDDNFSKQVLKQFFSNLHNKHKVREAGKCWEKYGTGQGDGYRAYGTKKRVFKKARIYFLIHNDPKSKQRTDYYIRDNDPSTVPFLNAA